MEMIRLSAAAAATLTCATLLLTPAAASTWTVDQGGSTLGFEVAQGTGSISGTFTDWSASIDLDPDNLETAVITARIALPSATTGNGQIDGTLPTGQFFNVAEFPAAEFTSETISLANDGSYVAEGSLALKGVRHPVTLSFTLDIEGDTATAKGTATLDRTVYNVGTGVGPDQVGADVSVTIDLTATR
ncbi:hypothetical protein GCM10011316_12660 [Roseibium aquae]|uniref:Lipid/polyisoprenoid-binding YceI-like domain-containing protein n=1 Tax=Roseibium aquae TaxID=1323746 RepID=A0A916WYF8_9HYPH|nr:YceI family protein [Roseibium aquae]GGB42213.1 hypothetical protein GCM10011316_12660 [Roseibium aquae]